MYSVAYVQKGYVVCDLADIGNYLGVQDKLLYTHILLCNAFLYRDQITGICCEHYNSDSYKATSI